MTVDVDTLSLDDIRKLAEAEAITASTTVDPVVDPPAAIDPVVDPPVTEGPFKFERTIDLGDGAGVQIFRGKGATREEAHEDLIDRLSEAQKHATKKIREQEAKLKTTPVEKTFTPEEESTYSHELMNTPTKGFKKLSREVMGVDPDELKEVIARDKQRRAKEDAEKIGNDFVASHPEYADTKENGDKIRELLTFRNDFSLQSFEKAYQYLNKSGLLEVKGEEASVEQKADEAEQQRIVAEANKLLLSQRTKRVSGLSTQRRVAVVPPAAPTEDDMYKMPLEELRKLANLQLAAH